MPSLTTEIYSNTLSLILDKNSFSGKLHNCIFKAGCLNHGTSLCYKKNHCVFDLGEMSNTWYISDEGSDQNDCHSESAPCLNLQTVLDRATDGADIYVTSDTLSLHGGWVESSISYSIQSVKGVRYRLNCSGKYKTVALHKCSLFFLLNPTYLQKILENINNKYYNQLILIIFAKPSINTSDQCIQL